MNMDKNKNHPKEKAYKWVLFFYTVPSKPVSNRMNIWRKLMRTGAVLAKGSVYILPFSSEHYEFFQWLVAEVQNMNGDAALITVARIDTMPDKEIIELFNQARRNDYLPLAGTLEEITSKLDIVRKGGEGVNLTSLAGQLEKLRKSYAAVQAIDFFGTSEGMELNKKIDQLHNELGKWICPAEKPAGQKELSREEAINYQHRIWVTRKHPFVDRMASAWLIKRFIDPEATFAFIDPDAPSALTEEAVRYDMFEGEFTHHGDLCTFEVLIHTFGLKDKALKQMAEIVHNLDIKDDKYQAPEARGVEGILNGIRKSGGDDNDVLVQGMNVCEALYLSKKA